MVHTRDSDEAALWDAVRIEAIAVKDDLLTNLARKIVEEQAKAEERGRQRSGGR